METRYSEKQTESSDTLIGNRASRTEPTRSQKNKVRMEYRKDGKNDGFNAAQEMEYADFLLIEKAYEVLSSPTADYLAAEEAIGEYVFARWLEETIEEMEAEDSAFDREEYLRAWVVGVIGARTAFKDELYRIEEQ